MMPDEFDDWKREMRRKAVEAAWLEEKEMEKRTIIRWAADRNSPVDGDTNFDVLGFEADLLSRGYKVVKA